jgi:predicted porin
MAPKQPAELSNKEEIHTMQKKLIAAAIAGLVAVPALAQTNVTISGNFRAGWESYKLTDCTAGQSCRSESRVSDQSSGLRFNVVEDLGGGLKAWGQLDYRGAVDLGGLANSGNSGVGFMGDNWGKFTFGRWDVHYNEITGALQATRAGSLQTLVGHGIISQMNGTMIANGTRTPNLMMWDSPNWNGFTGRVAYSTGFEGNEGSGKAAAGTGNPGGGRAWTGALRYNNGPWVGGLSYWNANGESRVTGVAKNDQRSTRAWLGYTFGMGLKVGFAWDSTKRDTGLNGGASATMKRSGWMIPVTYSFGPHAVYGAYSRVGKHSGSAVAAGTGGDYKANQWMIGYDYAFSKRTTAGVFYTRVNNNTLGGYDMFNGAGLAALSGATHTAANEGSRQIYIGMNHNF